MHETMDVWVAWTNTDLTEGRGEQIPYAVCRSEATAKRLGRGKSVQGSNCTVGKATAIKVDNRWLGPIRLRYPSKEDEAADAYNTARRNALEKARAAGLTDEEIELLS